MKKDEKLPRPKLFAEKLSRLLDLNGEKQIFLAKSLTPPADPSAASYWCTGKRLPEWHHMLQIAKRYKVSVDYLIDDDAEFTQSRTEQEERLLMLARMLGHERAEARLLQISPGPEEVIPWKAPATPPVQAERAKPGTIPVDKGKPPKRKPG